MESLNINNKTEPDLKVMDKTFSNFFATVTHNINSNTVHTMCNYKDDQPIVNSFF